MFKNTSNYRNKIILLSVIQVLLLLAVLVWSVITGQYPLTLKSLLSGDTMSIMVFKRLRLPRALMGVIGSFCFYSIHLHICIYWSCNSPHNNSAHSLSCPWQKQLYYRACRYSYSFCGTDYTYVSKACRRS